MVRGQGNFLRQGKLFMFNFQVHAIFLWYILHNSRKANFHELLAVYSGCRSGIEIIFSLGWFIIYYPFGDRVK